MAFVNTVNRISKKKARQETWFQWILRKMPHVINSLNAVKLLVNAEKKMAGFTTAQYSITSSGVIHHLTSIAQGGANNQRTGKSVLLHDILLRGIFKRDTVDDVVRVILFVDTQGEDGTVVTTVTDVLNSASVLAIRNDDEMDRFHIVFDKMYKFNDTEKETHVFKFYRKLQFHTTWTQGSTLGTGVQANHLYLLTIGTQAANGVTFEYHYRIMYYDN